MLLEKLDTLAVSEASWACFLCAFAAALRACLCSQTAAKAVFSKTYAWARAEEDMLDLEDAWLIVEVGVVSDTLAVLGSVWGKGGGRWRRFMFVLATR